jgi:hypothetical protein
MTYGEWHKMMREQVAQENLLELLKKIDQLTSNNEKQITDQSKK